MTATDPAVEIHAYLDARLKPQFRPEDECIDIGLLSNGKPLRVMALRAVLDELKRLRDEHAVLLEGNQRLQTMNEGLRQVAIQAREAADAWHRATIDLYSGRDEPHPADCPCGRQQPEPTGAAK